MLVLFKNISYILDRNQDDELLSFCQNMLYNNLSAFVYLLYHLYLMYDLALQFVVYQCSSRVTWSPNLSFVLSLKTDFGLQEG